MDNDTKAMSTKELTQAVSLLLDREKQHADEERRINRRRKREEREANEAAKQRLIQSVELIKWCMIGITTVMVVALVVLIMVVTSVKQEAERIKAEVVHIQREAEMIREKIRHPFESVGGMLGRQFDGKIGEAFGIGKDSKE